MNETEFTQRVVSTMESLGIPYFITGSIASIALGEPRYTNDIDVVADISLATVSKILAEFPAPDFYVSESAARDAVNRKFQFNIIHPSSGLKVDVIIPSDDEFNRLRMKRKIRLAIDDEHFAWFASAEDLILKKLVFFQMGGSDKHLRDISGVMLVQAERIDQAYLDEWASKLGVCTELELVRRRIRERGQ